MKIIPIVHCFDHNYVLPAGVAFRSLLEHAHTPGAHYALHVIGTGLTDADRTVLRGVVAPFLQASLAFHEPPPLPIPERDLGNLSRDVFYKLLVPELFPQYETALVADVDVVYADDVAPFLDEIRPEDDCYLAGTPDIGYATWRGEGIRRDEAPLKFFKRYLKLMTPEEREKLVMGAGFFAMNLGMCRRDGMSARWIRYARDNFRRLVLMEMDVLNLCCHPKIKIVSSRYMAIAGYKDRYDRLSKDERMANPAWDEMFANPVQIHYASGVKPWKFPNAPAAELWFEAAWRADLFTMWRHWHGRFSAEWTHAHFEKRLIDWMIPLGKRFFRFTLRKGRRAKNAEAGKDPPRQ